MLACKFVRTKCLHLLLFCQQYWWFLEFWNVRKHILYFLCWFFFHVENRISIKSTKYAFSHFKIQEIIKIADNKAKKWKHSVLTNLQVSIFCQTQIPAEETKCRDKMIGHPKAFFCWGEQEIFYVWLSSEAHRLTELWSSSLV